MSIGSFFRGVLVGASVVGAVGGVVVAASWPASCQAQGYYAVPCCGQMTSTSNWAVGANIGGGSTASAVAAKAAAEVEAKADPQRNTWREVFTDTKVTLQRKRVYCSDSYHYGWDDVGSFSTAEAATGEMRRLVDLETRAAAGVVVSFDAQGSAR